MKLSIKIGLIFFAVIGSFILTGCSGCSQSGVRNKQKERSFSNSSQTNSQPVNHSTNQVAEKRNNTSTNNETLPLNMLYQKYSPSVFLIYTSDGTDSYQGTGFFVSKGGIAVSNYHVFKGTSQGLEVIETHDGKRFNIEKILNNSDENDYIIFKVKLSGYNISNPFSIAMQEPQIGEDVFAIGNPRGLESTLSKDIVSGFRENKQLIQTTTEITHGSSGGPLLNMKGEVVGITSAGLGEANLNFAINIKYIPINKYILGN